MIYRHIIPSGDLAAEHRRLIKADIDELPSDKPLLVQIKLYKSRRSLEQNSYLHAVPLKLICDETGYEIEDMKAYLMGEAFGWVEYEIMGNTRKKPRLTTSQLNKEQMSWFFEWLEQWAAQTLDLIIPKPNEVIE
jgi:hypothetical protein